MLKYSQLTLDCNICPRKAACQFMALKNDYFKIPLCPMLGKEWLNPSDLIIAAKPVTRELTKAWLAEHRN